MTIQRFTLGAATFAALMGSTALYAQETITIGGLATLEGPFAGPGEDGLRGVELAIEEFGGEIAGHLIEMITASSDGNPDVALESARRLVQQDGVDIMVGPLSGSEGIRIAQYAKEQPGTTFLNGGSAAIETTLVDPAENFFRFNTEGAQWTAPLGGYVVNERGWDNIVIVSEDYSFPYAQIFGFMATYCEAGGTVEDKYFTPVGNNDYSSVIAQLPLEAGEVDGMYVVLGGSGLS
jgi:branched-chain amino acid transport system substrate-binding protein